MITYLLNHLFMKAIIPILLMAAITTLGHAQNFIKPGDRIIRNDWIKPSHDFYKNVIRDTSGKIIYEFMMDDVTTIDQAHKQITFIRSRQVPIGSFSADTSITDLSFKPLSMHETLRQKVHYDMLFTDNQATVKAIRNAVSSVKTYPMMSGYFEDNMIEYIFGYLELKKGITYTLDNFNKDTPSPSDPYALTYLFDDVWPLAADHQLTYSVIRFTHGDTEGYIWIDQGTHQVIKQQGNFKGGSYLITKL